MLLGWKGYLSSSLLLEETLVLQGPKRSNKRKGRRVLGCCRARLLQRAPVHHSSPQHSTAMTKTVTLARGVTEVDRMPAAPTIAIIEASTIVLVRKDDDNQRIEETRKGWRRSFHLNPTKGGSKSKSQMEMEERQV